MAAETAELFAEVLDEGRRDDPYPLYSLLRETPVSRQADGVYAVSTYAEIRSLLHDRRISSDERNSAGGIDSAPIIPQAAAGRFEPGKPPFLFLDPPDHTRLRRLVMKEFHPRVIEGMRYRVVELVDMLLDTAAERGRLDVVADLAYPLPVTVICEMLGVPKEDEHRFHGWATALVGGLDPGQRASIEQRERRGRAIMESAGYLLGLIDARRSEPRDDLLSALVAVEEQGDRLSERELVSTINLLLIAGHETTVNLVANGMLALLRHPDALERLRNDPGAVPGAIEEVLRYDPPVQFRTRTTLEEIEVGGTTIPARSGIVLLLASGSRDPAQFPHPDRFDIDRAGNRHLGFGGGAHYCVGAPLARLEAQIALRELARRLVRPRLVEDPPPYRANAALRGPRELFVEFEGLAPASGGRHHGN